MPFSEPKEGSESPLRDEPIKEADPERAERRRQEAISYLIESRRAKTFEEAEQYLDSLNRLKKQVLLLVRDLMRDRRIATGDAAWHYDLPEVHFGRDILTHSDLDKIITQGPDRHDPRVWELSRTVTPDYRRYLQHNSGRVREVLRIGTSDQDIVIDPEMSGSGSTAGWLKQYLSDDQFQFLKQEYIFALNDLERELRGVADSVAAQEESLHPAWKGLDLLKTGPRPTQ